MNNIIVFSHKKFDNFCKENKITDENVETDFKNYAFISIIGTQDSINLYLNEPNTKHWFNENHNNVINLDFDDVPRDLIYNGIDFKSISDEQTLELVKFIIANYGKNFIIHCRAGKSRSVAVGLFIKDLFKDDYKSPLEGFKTPNWGVYYKLMRSYENLVNENDKIVLWEK